MTRWSARFWAVIAVLAAGLVVAGAGALMVLAGLENADKISSVIGAAAGVLGLGMSAGSALRARRMRTVFSPAAPLKRDGPEAPPVAKDVSMRAKAKDDARIYQSGGDMTIHDR